MKKERDVEKKRLDDAAAKYAKFERQFVENKQKDEHMRKERKKAKETATQEAKKLEEKGEEQVRLARECAERVRHGYTGLRVREVCV